MKAKHTLALALALALLCVGYWGLLQTRRQVVQQRIEAKRLYAFDGAAVTSLEIQQVGEPAAAATRPAGGLWAMQKPHPAIVPLQPLWDRVAGALAQLKNERTITEEPGDVAQYGLTEPALTLTAQTEAGENIRLAFGGQEPTQTYRYAQLDDGTVFLVDEKAFFELNRSLPELRNRFLVNDRESALVRVEFARIWTGRGHEKMEHPPAVGEESVAVAVERDNPEAPWKMIEPVAAPADQEAVNALASEIQFALGRNHIDAPESLADYGLEPPSFRVTVRDAKTQEPQTIYLGDVQGGGGAEPAKAASGGGVYGKRADLPAVFLLDMQLMTLLPRTPDALRERRLFTGQAGAIRKLEYRPREGAGFTLENDPDAGWRLAQPALTDTNQAAVSQYVSALKALEASGFPGGSPADYGLDAPAAALVLTLDGQEAPATICFAPAGAEESYYYATQDTGSVALVYRARAEQLMVSSDYFRSREIFRFGIPEAVQLEFRFEGQDYVFERVHEKWLVKHPENMVLANQSDVLAILNAITPLSAQGAAVTSETGSTGLETPVFSVTVTTRSMDPGAGPVRLGPLSVGAVTEDDSQQRYASVAGREGVFRVGQGVVDTVRESLRGVRPGG